MHGHHDHAHGREDRCAAGFGTGLAVSPAHGGQNSLGEKTVTLRTQIARIPGRPAAGPSVTGAGSDAEQDHCGCGLVLIDKARPPRAGAAWPPCMGPRRFPYGSRFDPIDPCAHGNTGARGTPGADREAAGVRHRTEVADNFWTNGRSGRPSEPLVQPSLSSAMHS